MRTVEYHIKELMEEEDNELSSLESEEVLSTYIRSTRVLLKKISTDKLNELQSKTKIPIRTVSRKKRRNEIKKLSLDNSQIWVARELILTVTVFGK